MLQGLPEHEANQAGQHLQTMDESRVASALQLAGENPEAEIGSSTITALFEVLSFHTLLDDAEVNAATEAMLLGVSQHHDLALSEGGRYPGLYRLLAHHNQQLRLLVNPSLCQ